MSQQETQDMAKYFYRASAADFMKIPGGPVAYWASEQLRKAFTQYPQLASFAKPRQGLATSDNNRFLRFWFEPSIDKIKFDAKNREEAHESRAKWFPCQKGGGYRKWYGNLEYLVNWENDGGELLEYAASLYGSPTRTIKNIQFYFRDGLTWSTLTSGEMCMRVSPIGFISETKGAVCFFEGEGEKLKTLAIMNSAVINPLILTISPTLDFHEGPVGRLPINLDLAEEVTDLAEKCVELSKRDWDSYEESWNFQAHVLLGHVESKSSKIEVSLQSFVTDERKCISELRNFEQRINELVLKAYDLAGEIRSDVPIDRVTLGRNPRFSFGSTDDESDFDVLRSESLRELLSYAIGCMMGRYSLDKPALILARQGETLQDYLSQIPSPSFAPDDDAILPLTDQEWFADDATNRFREFVRVVWGDEHLQENLDFVAESLCLHAIKPKRGESAMDTIRRYLSTQFYKDHLRTYKKRPIYWLFSSGKHKAFECLVYLHRYNEGTLARMRTEYVIPLSAKLNAYAEKLEQDKEASTSAAETKRLEKEIATLHKQQVELAEFDEKLRHYADQRISLDLDDGVKVNYGKFGDLLAEVKAVTGEKPQ
jgi:type II restriction/modification system DNA methylase subunit YeeA